MRNRRYHAGDHHVYQSLFSALLEYALRRASHFLDLASEAMPRTTPMTLTLAFRASVVLI
jgi:hypothetical protein